MKSVNILTITFAVLLAVALCSAKPKTRFLVDDSKSQDTNELDDNTSEINTSEDTSENTSEDSDEKYEKRGIRHIRGSDENEPECGYGQCHYFQESQMLEDIQSCDGCAEWFNSKFENEKDRHV